MYEPDYEITDNQPFPFEETSQPKPLLTRNRLCFRFIIDFLIAIAVGVAIFLPLIFLVHDTEYELFFGALSTQLGFLIIFFFRLSRLKKRNQPIRPLCAGPLGPALRWGILMGIALFIMNILHGIAMDSLLDIDVAEHNPWMAIQDYGTFSIVGTLLVGALMAPIVEELLLRGLMFGTLAASGYPKTGVVFTTLLFITLHLDPTNSLAYAMLGLGFLWVYNRTQNLYAAILAHMINNILGFLFILLPY